ncbi:MAG: hypothetical protein K9N62_11195 [Verrucomicrobia bacterium]|nr:hypothetical protein [Verrucomicrobiota bacterium]
MNADTKTSLTLASLSVGFLVLAVGFQLELWGEPKIPAEVPPALATATNTATVRFSASDMIKAGGDTSGMECYACHEEGKLIELPLGEDGIVILPPDHKDLIYSRRQCSACHDKSQNVQIEWDDDGNVILPEAHRDLVLQHGAHHRNNPCFNCHVENKLTELETRGGKRLALTESTELCAGCHGPTYGDWEVGIHGRTSGFWDPNLGESTRKQCTSCHDPHAPKFPSMIPAPGPHALHAQHEPATEHADPAEEPEPSDPPEEH